MPTKRNHALVYRKVPPFLREMRKKAGLTQRQLAARVGLGQSWVARCETGSRRIDVAEFIEFCAGCGVEAVAAFADLARLRR